jgi:hypothetical protein
VFKSPLHEPEPFVHAWEKRICDQARKSIN